MLRDILGVPLAVGQRVVFMPATFLNSGPLCVGVVAALAPSIAIRSGGERFVLPARDATRVFVIQEREAETWVRRQLAELGFED